MELESKGQQHERSGQAKGLATTGLSDLLAWSWSHLILINHAAIHTFYKRALFYEILLNYIANPSLRRSLQLESPSEYYYMSNVHLRRKIILRLENR